MHRRIVTSVPNIKKSEEESFTNYPELSEIPTKEPPKFSCEIYRELSEAFRENIIDGYKAVGDLISVRKKRLRNLVSLLFNEPVEVSIHVVDSDVVISSGCCGSKIGKTIETPVRIIVNDCDFHIKYNEEYNKLKSLSVSPDAIFDEEKLCISLQSKILQFSAQE